MVQTPQTAPPPQPLVNTLSSTPVQTPGPPAFQQQPDPNIPFRAAETSANRLQESLVRIQQQIEANRAELRLVQQRIALQQSTNSGTTQNTRHMNANGQPIPNLPPQGFAMNIPFGPLFDQQQHLQRLAQRGPPNLNGAPPVQPVANVGPNMMSPFRQNVQEIHGPNGQRMTVVTESMNLRMPTQRPSSAPGQRPSTTSQQGASTSLAAPELQPAGIQSFVPPSIVNWPGAPTLSVGLPFSQAQIRP